MRLTPDIFKACVIEANLAPSVHNVQPARWALRFDGVVELSCDADVALSISDPEGTDLLFSCGTALEGMVMALRHHGFEVDQTLLPDPRPCSVVAELRCTAGTAITDPLREVIHTRRTCRSGFRPIPADIQLRLQALVDQQHDLHSITDAKRIDHWARENDRLSLGVFRNPAFRGELLSWMRLDPGHPDWSRDGLNAEAMNLSRLEARFVPLAFSRIVFGLLDKIGLSAGLVTEAPKTRQAGSILCLSVPEGQSELLNGRRYYRMTLELAALGLVTWPMAILVDEPSARRALEQELSVAQNDRLRNCLRVGFPDGNAQMRARRSFEALLADNATDA